MTGVVTPARIRDVAAQQRDDRYRFRVVFACTLLATLTVGAMAYSSAPKPLSLAMLLLAVSCTVAIARPHVGVQLIVFLSLIGDSDTAPWWPFTKNLSSRESILFLNDRVSVTPLEMLLTVTVGAFLVRGVAQPGWRIRAGALSRPMLVLGAFVMLSFARSNVGGGVRNVAILEARPLVYLVVLYVLMVNTFTERRHYRTAMLAAMVAVAIQSLFSLNYYRHLSAERRTDLESLSEHTATIAMNAMFLLVFAMVAFKGARWKTQVMGVLAIPVLVAYLLSQRRAAMVALFAGIVVLFGVLFHRRRAAFWSIIPPLLVAAGVFLAGTWNAGGAIGLPANAVKTVFFPNQLSERDRASDQYRVIEAYNLWSTIRESPLLGKGFGQKFSVIVPLPDISFFPYWQYLPHNTILWVWIKLGFFGFVAMLYVMGSAVRAGSASAIRVSRPEDAAIVVVALAYVVMFAVFAYVDIAFGIRPAVLLALSIALCADFDRLADESGAGRDREVAIGRPVRVRAAS